MDYEALIPYLVPKLCRIFRSSERSTIASTVGRTWVPHEGLKAHCERKGREVVLFPTTVHTQASASRSFLHEDFKLYDNEEIRSMLRVTQDF